MTNEEILACVEVAGAECIHSLTVLAAHIESLDRLGDAEIVSAAARDIAGVVISLRHQLLPGFLGHDLTAYPAT